MIEKIIIESIDLKADFAITKGSAVKITPFNRKERILPQHVLGVLDVKLR